MKKKVIAFIPVRGGSKSIPLKNIKNLGGQPLIYWALQAACESKKIDQVVIATDHLEIIEAAKNFSHSKVKIYHRQKENAQDTSSTESVMLEYLSANKMSAKDQFVLIQATNPFLKTEHLDQALDVLNQQNADSLLSVVRNKRFFWTEKGKAINYDFKKRPRRQDFQGLMMENGAFYINNVGNILKSKNRLSGKIALFEMPEYSGFEIDEPDDWTICESLLFQNGHQKKIDYSQVKLFITDVDGVLTDAGMYYSENGDAMKKFNTLDGMGMNLIREKGIEVGIITGENTPIVAKRAEKLKIKILHQGISDKLSVLKKIVRERGINLCEVAYIGDDINDLEILSAVGFPACPASAVPQIKAIPGILKLSRSGGQGVVREYIEEILTSHKKEA
jgi:N-acylneuraminate cytidylyltransferase